MRSALIVADRTAVPQQTNRTNGHGPSPGDEPALDPHDEIARLEAEIANHSQGLQEDFGEHDGRAEVDHHAPAIHPRQNGAQHAEVPIGRLAKLRGREARLLMRDVRADRHVDGEGDAEAVRGGQDA